MSETLPERQPQHEPWFVADERTQVERLLEENRQELVDTVAGLTDEQARRRLVPSETTLLGLLKHACFVEQVWFHVAVEGRTRASLGLPDDAGDSFVLTDDDTVASVLAEYDRIRVEAREILAAHDLTDLALHNKRSPITVRWIVVHMIEELARHAGHADILREQVLAADAAESQA